MMSSGGGGGGGNLGKSRSVAAYALGSVAMLGWLGARMSWRRKQSTVPPVAEKRGRMVVFGKVAGEERGEAPMDPPICRDDPLFWLRDDKREDPAVLAHLRAENAYTASQTAHLEKFKKKLYAEILSHVKETDESVPVPHGGFEYYSRTVKGSSYRIYCRRPKESATETVLLDMNVIAKGKKHCDLGGMKASPDHGTLAYSLDESGYETYNAFFKDVESGAMLAETLPDMTGSLVWGKDDQTVFYSVHDEAHRPYQLYRHRMGTDKAEDELLFTESDQEFWLGFGKSLSGRFLIVETGTSETSEALVLDLEDPAQTALKLVHAREEKLLYSLDHHGEHFYIVTNAEGAKNQKLMRAPVASPEKQNWEDVLPYDAAVNIEDVDCFENHLVISGREGGFSAVWVLNPADARSLVKLGDWPDPVSVVEVGANREFATNVVRVEFESMVTPATTFDVDMDSMQRTKVHQKEVPNYDAALYECRRLGAAGHDGTNIPMSMVFKKEASSASAAEPDASRRTPGPTYLIGYGSYGICYEPNFVAALLPLLDRGVTVVFAHIRGGGEMGRTWYEDEGKFLAKKNTFKDFVSCAEHLIAERYATSDTLAISGRSAGGLLMGAVLNMAPHLFKCVIAGVPFVDLMNTMCDPSIPLTCVEWREWGNPNLAEFHDYMLSYSPYDNVTTQDYPAMLVVTGLWDPRVAYWEPAKWVARLRERKTDDNVILLKTDLAAGHFSASDRYKYLSEKAFEYAFLLDQLGFATAKGKL